MALLVLAMRVVFPHGGPQTDPAVFGDWPIPLPGVV